MNSCANGHPRIAFEAPACPLCADRHTRTGETDRLTIRLIELAMTRDALSHKGRVNEAIIEGLARENDRLRREHPGVPK